MMRFGRTPLVVFSGLPGVGKTTLARPVADALGGTFLRIDTIEAAVARSGIAVGDAPVGYLVASWLAADQLRAGRPVVTDAVNSVEIARIGWHEVAAENNAEARFVRVICSDVDEHRRRVETRVADLDGHVLPTWAEVSKRAWQPLKDDHLLIDNVGELAVHVDEVLAWLRGAVPALR